MVMAAVILTPTLHLCYSYHAHNSSSPNAPLSMFTSLSSIVPVIFPVTNMLSHHLNHLSLLGREETGTRDHHRQ